MSSNYERRQEEGSIVPWLMVGLLCSVILLGVGVYHFKPELLINGVTVAEQEGPPPASVPTQTIRQTISDRGQETPRYQPATIPVQPAATPKPFRDVDRSVEPAVWSNDLPDCTTGQQPCVMNYSEGIPAEAPASQLATGGTNTGTDGHPQKDEDLKPAGWNGDKP